MKHTLFMYMILLWSFHKGLLLPIYGVIPYTVFSILQPHHLWKWSLAPGVRWSFYGAIVAFSVFSVSGMKHIKSFKLNTAEVLMLLFFIFVLISTFASTNPAVSYDWFTRTYLKMYVMYFLASFVMINARSYFIYYIVIVSSVFYLGYHFNSLYYFDGRMDLFYYGLGAFDNNHMGLFLGFGIVFSYAVFAGSTNVLLKLSALFLGGLAAHGVMLSFSRGGMLSACAGLLTIAIYYRKKLQLIILAPLVLLVLGIMAGEEVRDEFRSISTYQQDPSATGRIDAWRAAWAITMDYPLSGVGIRMSNTLLPQYGGRTVRAIHSHYLQTSADMGFPALIVWVLIWLAITVGLIRKLRQISWYQRETGKEVLLSIMVWRYQLNLRMDDLGISLIGFISMYLTGSLFLSLEGFEIAFFIILMASKFPFIADELMSGEGRLKDEKELLDRKNALI